MDNRSLREAGKWPTSTEHATHTRDALEWADARGATALKLDRKWARSPPASRPTS